MIVGFPLRTGLHRSAAPDFQIMVRSEMLWNAVNLDVFIEYDQKSLPIFLRILGYCFLISYWHSQQLILITRQAQKRINSLKTQRCKYLFCSVRIEFNDSNNSNSIFHFQCRFPSEICNFNSNANVQTQKLQLKLELEIALARTISKHPKYQHERAAADRSRGRSGPSKSF